MKLFFRILKESTNQAFSALIANKLRTFLSLLGIMIGIFCIISVLSAVNSLESSIKDGFGELGSDVVMVDVMPWDEDPGQNYWKYAKRPPPTHKDYEFLKKRLDNFKAAAYSIFVPGKTVKYKSSSVTGAFVMGSTYEFPEVQDIKIAEGRFFTEKEYRSASNKVILGAKVAKELFPLDNYLDKFVKIFGHKFQIIGVLEEEGENPFNFLNYDEVIWLGYNTATRFINVKGQNRFNVGRILYVKAEEGQTLDELKDEITGVMRAAHRLKPREDNDFSLNELSMLTNMIDSVFGAVYFAGFLIGIFALCVGMFSVANIMFVSVRERTNQIGIKKALGAKRNTILSEFLIESIILCIIGGIAGLGLVMLVLKIASGFLPFELGVSTAYVLIGVGTSILVGVISGIIPALLAARMDPVEAIRSKG